MKLAHLISIGLFTIVTVLTVYGWSDRIHGTSAVLKENFADTDEQLALLRKGPLPPTDEEAVKAHQTLLRYIKNDFSKGIKFVMDFGQRFFGENMTLRTDLDVRRLMDNYSSPLQRQ